MAFSFKQPSKKSFFHKLDFRTKLLVIILMSISVVFINDIRILLALFGLFFSFLLFSRNFMRLKGLLLYIISFWIIVTLIVYLFTMDMKYTLNYFSTYFTRMNIMLLAGFLLAFTTSPNDMAKSLEKLHLPRSIIFTFTTALNSIPFFFRELKLISESLKLRGVLSNGIGSIKNIKYIYRGYLIPLIIRIFKISDEKTASAEIRGLRAPIKRISINEIKIRAGDWIFFIFIIFVIGFCFYIDKIFLPSDIFYAFNNLF